MTMLVSYSISQLVLKDHSNGEHWTILWTLSQKWNSYLMNKETCFVCLQNFNTIQ